MPLTITAKREAHRYWAIYFEDSSVTAQLFTSESAAREAYAKYKESWNCVLFCEIESLDAECAAHQETQANYRELAQAHLDERVAHKETQAIARELVEALEQYYSCCDEALIAKAKDVLPKE